MLSDPPEGAASPAISHERRCPSSRGRAFPVQGVRENERARRCPGCTTRSVHLAAIRPAGLSARRIVAPPQGGAGCRDRRGGETFVLESRKGERKLNRKPRKQGPKARPLARACRFWSQPIAAAQPYPAGAQRGQREGGAGSDALLVSYPPVAAAPTSLTRASTPRLETRCISRRSAATARSRASCAGGAASPPSTSTAI